MNLRVLIISDGASGMLINALRQSGIDVISEEEQDMGIFGRPSGLSRLALAIASMIVASPSVAFNFARQADYQVKGTYPTGQNDRHYGPQRHAYGQAHPAVHTRRYRNATRRSSMNPNPDL